jgi:hypothetical protein
MSAMSEQSSGLRYDHVSGEFAGDKQATIAALGVTTGLIVIGGDNYSGAPQLEEATRHGYEYISNIAQRLSELLSPEFGALRPTGHPQGQFCADVNDSSHNRRYGPTGPGINFDDGTRVNLRSSYTRNTAVEPDRGWLSLLDDLTPIVAVVCPTIGSFSLSANRVSIARIDPGDILLRLDRDVKPVFTRRSTRTAGPPIVLYPINGTEHTVTYKENGHLARRDYYAKSRTQISYLAHTTLTR